MSVDDLFARLASLGADPETYRTIIEREGIESVRSFIDRLAPRSAPLAVDWAEAKTYEFACRDLRPPTPSEKLDGAERALLPIVRTKVREAKDQASAGFPPTTFVAPLWALSVLEEEWPGRTQSAIFLSQEEHCARPRSEYRSSPPYLGIQLRFWFVHRVGDGSPYERWLDPAPPEAEPSESLWIAVSGHTYSPWSGCSHAELWSWKANEIRYLRSLGMLQG